MSNIKTETKQGKPRIKDVIPNCIPEILFWNVIWYKVFLCAKINL